MGAESGLEWTLDWGPAALTVAALLGVAVIAMTAWTTRTLPPLRRAVVLALRATTTLLLLAALLQPSWVELRPRPDDRVIAVIVDATRSMAPGGKPARHQRAVAEARALSRRVPTRTYVLSPLPTEVDDAGDVAPTAAPTDLLAALKALAEGVRPAGMSAAVLLSDGRDHGALGHAGVDLELQDALAALDVPLHTIAIGDARPLRDIVVGDVRASSHALVRSPLPLEIDLDLGSYAGSSGSLDLVLELDGAPVATERVALGGEQRRRVRAAVTPATTGAHVITVRAVALPDELTVSNNRIHVPVRVLRDRTRVMHLAGHPSPDTRFLRAHLQDDPMIDLVSFYIMIGRAARVFIDPEDTTLIPFPTEQLMVEALDDFDLVIFHDFAFGSFDIERLIPSRLGPWIERGGALLVIGGRGTLAAGGYDSSSIQDWLPVEVGSGEGWSEASVVPVLTDAGAAHPLTRLRDDKAVNRLAWAQGRLPGHNTQLRGKDGDAVLAATEGGAPLLAVGERREGRVAVVASDALWTWAFPQGGERSRADARADYRRLQQQLRGWLLRDPAFASIAIDVPDVAVEPGATFEVVVRARRADQQPAANETLHIRDVPLPAVAGAARERTVVSDAHGVARFQLLAQAPGPHRLEVRLGTLPVQSAAYAVAEGAAEDLDLRADPDLMRRLADAGGGLAVARSDALSGDALLGHRPVLHERVRTVLWWHPLVWLLLVGLLLAEWALRRRFGLA